MRNDDPGDKSGVSEIGEGVTLPLSDPNPTLTEPVFRAPKTGIVIEGQY